MFFCCDDSANGTQKRSLSLDFLLFVDKKKKDYV